MCIFSIGESGFPYQSISPEEVKKAAGIPRRSQMLNGLDWNKLLIARNWPIGSSGTQTGRAVMGDLFGLGSKAIDNVRSVLRDEGSAFFETASIDDYFLTDGLKNPASLQEIAPKVNKEPIMQIYPRGELGGDFTNVFAPNLSG